MGRWHVGIPHISRATWMAVALLCASPPVWGTEFAGQVVGITDGDTITVLHQMRWVAAIEVARLIIRPINFRICWKPPFGWPVVSSM